jgi:hypothetical protein
MESVDAAVGPAPILRVVEIDLSSLFHNQRKKPSDAARFGEIAKKFSTINLYNRKKPQVARGKSTILCQTEALPGRDCRSGSAPSNFGGRS